MDRLEQKHIDFLRICAEAPNRIHQLPEDVSQMDADAMANEGLLIKYNRPTAPQYAIARYGSQFVKEHSTASPEMRKLAIAYVMSKIEGGSEEDAEKIVNENGVETILRTQAEEMRHGSQREVKVPTNELGAPEIKFRG
jgi:hypothetical protein